MIYKPGEYINFLKCLTEIQSTEFLLLSAENGLVLIKSSVPAIKFFNNWSVTSTIKEYLNENEYNTILNIARKGKGEFLIPLSSFSDLNWEPESITAISLLKGYISVLFNKKNQLKKTHDPVLNQNFLIQEIYFALNLNSQKIDFVSSSVEDILGFTQEEVINFNIDYIKSLGDQNEINLILSRIESYTSTNIRKSLPLQLEFRLKDKSHTDHFFLCKSIRYIRDIDQLFQVGILSDITIEKDPDASLQINSNRLENTVRKYNALLQEYDNLKEKDDKHNAELEDTYDRMTTSEEIFRQLAENTNDILWLRDGMDILYINNQFENIWGRSKAEVIENPYILTEWIHPDDRDNFEPWVNLNNLVKGSPYVEQYRIIKPDGEVRWLWSRIFPIFNKENIPYRLVGIASDITEQKDFEEALRIAKEKAQESDMLKSAFLANISHEIRTPMNGIVGFAELLSRDDIETDTRKSYVSIMKKSSEQLIHIIDDIIDFAKIEANQIRVVQDRININRLLEQLGTVFQNHLLQKGVESVELIVEKQLEDSNAMILSDEHRLNQIMSYLIENAIKYTSEGHIKFGYHVLDKKIEFFVTDTGIGIPKDKHELIFERFRQVDEGNTRKFGGTGLGLPIARGLINLLGGTISLKSEPGKGSTFFFSIPYQLPENQNKTSTEIISNTNIDYLNDKLILVAEDDELNFEYIKVLLESTGARLIRAKDGSQAVKMCSNLQFDLILMDIRMPVINGIQATRQIRDMGIKIPIIAQTAFAMDDDEKLCLNAGCNDYIAKPLNREKLFNLINKYI
jgi:PAS domain S-box-containing protein